MAPSRTRSGFARTLGWAAPLGLVAACGSKGTVAVSALIDRPAIAVGAASVLANTLQGSFDVLIQLGEIAPSGTDASFANSNFTLVGASDHSALLLLKITPQPAPPYHLDPGGQVRVHMAIGEAATTPQLVTAAEMAAVCQAKSVQIAGSVSDSASGATTPVTSVAFEVTGCP